MSGTTAIEREEVLVVASKGRGASVRIKPLLGTDAFFKALRLHDEDSPFAALELQQPGTVVQITPRPVKDSQTRKSLGLAFDLQQILNNPSWRKGLRRFLEAEASPEELDLLEQIAKFQRNVWAYYVRCAGIIDLAAHPELMRKLEARRVRGAAPLWTLPFAAASAAAAEDTGTADPDEAALARLDDWIWSNDDEREEVISVLEAWIGDELFERMLVNTAEEIVRTFLIDEKSPVRVAVDAVTREQIVSAVSELAATRQRYLTSKPPSQVPGKRLLLAADPYLFNDLYNAIFIRLQFDAFVKFIKSPAYDDVIAEASGSLASSSVIRSHSTLGVDISAISRQEVDLLVTKESQSLRLISLPRALSQLGWDNRLARSKSLLNAAANADSEAIHAAINSYSFVQVELLGCRSIRGYLAGADGDPPADFANKTVSVYARVCVDSKAFNSAWVEVPQNGHAQFPESSASWKVAPIFPITPQTQFVKIELRAVNRPPPSLDAPNPASSGNAESSSTPSNPLQPATSNASGVVTSLLSIMPTYGANPYFGAISALPIVQTVQHQVATAHRALRSAQRMISSVDATSGKSAQLITPRALQPFEQALTTATKALNQAIGGASANESALPLLPSGSSRTGSSDVLVGTLVIPLATISAPWRPLWFDLLTPVRPTLPSEGPRRESSKSREFQVPRLKVCLRLMSAQTLAQSILSNYKHLNLDAESGIWDDEKENALLARIPLHAGMHIPGNHKVSPGVLVASHSPSIAWSQARSQLFQLHGEERTRETLLTVVSARLLSKHFPMPRLDSFDHAPRHKPRRFTEDGISNIDVTYYTPSVLLGGQKLFNTLDKFLGFLELRHPNGACLVINLSSELIATANPLLAHAPLTAPEVYPLPHRHAHGAMINLSQAGTFDTYAAIAACLAAASSAAAATIAAMDTAHATTSPASLAQLSLRRHIVHWPVPAGQVLPFSALVHLCNLMDAWHALHPQNVVLLVSRDGVARPGMVAACYSLFTHARRMFQYGTQHIDPFHRDAVSYIPMTPVEALRKVAQLRATPDQLSAVVSLNERERANTMSEHRTQSFARALLKRANSRGERSGFSRRLSMLLNLPNKPATDEANKWVSEEVLSGIDFDISATFASFREEMEQQKNMLTPPMKPTEPSEGRKPLTKPTKDKLMGALTAGIVNSPTTEPQSPSTSGKPMSLARFVEHVHKPVEPGNVWNLGGIFTPSQIRYVNYFHQWLRQAYDDVSVVAKYYLRRVERRQRRSEPGIHDLRLDDVEEFEEDPVQQATTFLTTELEAAPLLLLTSITVHPVPKALRQREEPFYAVLRGPHPAYLKTECTTCNTALVAGGTNPETDGAKALGEDNDVEGLSFYVDAALARERELAGVGAAAGFGGQGVLPLGGDLLPAPLTDPSAAAMYSVASGLSSSPSFGTSGSTTMPTFSHQSSLGSPLPGSHLSSTTSIDSASFRVYPHSLVASVAAAAGLRGVALGDARSAGVCPRGYKQAEKFLEKAAAQEKGIQHAFTLSDTTDSPLGQAITDMKADFEQAAAKELRILASAALAAVGEPHSTINQQLNAMSQAPTLSAHHTASAAQGSPSASLVSGGKETNVDGLDLNSLYSEPAYPQALDECAKRLLASSIVDSRKPGPLCPVVRSATATNASQDTKDENTVFGINFGAGIPVRGDFTVELWQHSGWLRSMLSNKPTLSVSLNTRFLVPTPQVQMKLAERRRQLEELAAAEADLEALSGDGEFRGDWKIDLGDDSKELFVNKRADGITLRLRKEHLDIACEDTQHKHLPEDFLLEISFDVPPSAVPGPAPRIKVTEREVVIPTILPARTQMPTLPSKPELPSSLNSPTYSNMGGAPGDPNPIERGPSTYSFSSDDGDDLPPPPPPPLPPPVDEDEPCESALNPEQTIQTPAWQHQAVDPSPARLLRPFPSLPLPQPPAGRTQAPVGLPKQVSLPIPPTRSIPPMPSLLPTPPATRVPPISTTPPPTQPSQPILPSAMSDEFPSRSSTPTSQPTSGTQPPTPTRPAAPLPPLPPLPPRPAHSPTPPPQAPPNL